MCGGSVLRDYGGDSYQHQQSHLHNLLDAVCSEMCSEIIEVALLMLILVS